MDEKEVQVWLDAHKDSPELSVRPSYLPDSEEGELSGVIEKEFQTLIVDRVFSTEQSLPLAHRTKTVDVDGEVGDIRQRTEKRTLMKSPESHTLFWYIRQESNFKLLQVTVITALAATIMGGGVGLGSFAIGSAFYAAGLMSLATAQGAGTGAGIAAGLFMAGALFYDGLFHREIEDRRIEPIQKQVSPELVESWDQVSPALYEHFFDQLTIEHHSDDLTIGRNKRQYYLFGNELEEHMESVANQQELKKWLVEHEYMNAYRSLFGEPAQG